LRPFVRRFLHSFSDRPGRHLVPVPPTGACYFTHVYRSTLRLHFAQGDTGHCPALFVGGQLQREMPIGEVIGPIGLVGAELQPTTLFRLFGKDCRAFTDRIADVGESIPGGSRLTRALETRHEIQAKVDVLTDFFQGWSREATPPSPVDHAIGQIERAGGQVAISDVAQACRWSTRHLHRRFLEEVGIAPKLYAKIVQINRVMAAIHEEDGPNLPRLAQECGYYDQAQFIRDFQRLVGTNPMDFLRHPDPFLRIYLGRK